MPEMFRGFRGILVSDFYAAYDAIDCRQQRCLVHLMRDLDEEIMTIHLMASSKCSLLVSRGC